MLNFLGIIMQSDPFRTVPRINSRPTEPSNDIIKSNLNHLKIRPKDVDDIVKDAQNAYKMVVEQVFLVMRYVRQLMMQEQNHLAINGRMNLLLTIFESKEEHDQEELDQEELEKIQRGVLQKLEENVGSNDVIAYLQSLESKESAYMLIKMQENGVAFAPARYIVGSQILPRPYAYYDMYTCLQHPIELFEKLLSQDVHDEKKVERLIYDKIKYHANSINPKGSGSLAMIIHKDMPEEKQQHIFKLSKEEDFAQIIKDYSSTDKDIILQEIRSELAIELGEWASDIFARISNPSYSRLLASKPWRKKLTFNNFFDISHNLGNTVISLDSGLVNNLHKINQLDDLFDSLKLALKAKLSMHTGGRPWEKEQSINNEDALAGISAWYDRYSTGMLRKIDQIPKAIASIIYFDLKNHSPSLKNAISDAEILRAAYDDSRKEKDEKRASPVRERNLLLTFIISLNLYLRDDKNKNNLEDLVERIKRNDIKSINTLSTFNNSIMSSWSIFDHNEDGSLDAEFGLSNQDKMMYRFKTIPVFFKKNVKTELNELLWMISNQASTENPVPFPYNSAFPWPLWIKKPQGFGYKYISKVLGYRVYKQSFIKKLI